MSVTEVEEVDVAPLLMLRDPVGLVVSDGEGISASVVDEFLTRRTTSPVHGAVKRTVDPPLTFAPACAVPFAGLYHSVVKVPEAEERLKLNFAALEVWGAAVRPNVPKAGLGW